MEQEFEIMSEETANGLIEAFEELNKTNTIHS